MASVLTPVTESAAVPVPVPVPVPTNPPTAVATTEMTTLETTDSTLTFTPTGTFSPSVATAVEVPLPVPVPTAAPSPKPKPVPVPTAAPTEEPYLPPDVLPPDPVTLPALVPAPVQVPVGIADDATSYPTQSPSHTFYPTYFPSTTFGPTAPLSGSGTIATKSPTVSPTAADSYSETLSLTGTGTRATKSPTIPPTSGNPTKAPIAVPTLRPTFKEEQVRATVKGTTFVGFQSDWGPAHPGSMVYDFTRNAVYVTGTTFAANHFGDTENDFKRSTCFVGELPIAEIEQWKTYDTPKPPAAGKNKTPLIDPDFVVPDSLDDREVMGCHAVYYDDQDTGNDILYVAGVSEPDAIARNGDINAFMNFYQRSRTTPDWKLKQKPMELTVGDSVTAVPTRWPVAMSSGVSKSDDSIVILSVSSEDNLMTEKYIENGDANNANNFKNSLIPPGVNAGDPDKSSTPKRGTDYYMTMSEYIVRDKVLVFKRGEDLKVSTPGHSIFPTGIANLNPEGLDLIMVGNIKGSSPKQFGTFPTKLTSDGDPTSGFNDLDGFSNRVQYPRDRPAFNSFNLRFSSVELDPPLDDFVHGLCAEPVDATGTSKAYYVIGSTYGTMPPASRQDKITSNILSGNDSAATNGNVIDKLSAWISKIDIETKAVIWTTQLYAINNDYTLDGGRTEAFGCHVIDQDPSRMYVGGTVYNGGIMDSSQTSAGDDDVWVAKLSTEDGSLVWIRQIGSSGRDRIAHTNGVEADLNGHAIIFGETNGELYRKRNGEDMLKKDGSSSDIFVATLDKISGQSTSTIEFDRVVSKKRKSLASGLSITALILMAVCIVLYCKWKKSMKHGSSRPKLDENENLNAEPAFHDEHSDDEDGSYSDPKNSKTPPKAAFSDNPAPVGGVV